MYKVKKIKKNTGLFKNYEMSHISQSALEYKTVIQFEKSMNPFKIM